MNLVIAGLIGAVLSGPFWIYLVRFIDAVAEATKDNDETEAGP